ncbi:unnamed protein product [Adineta ricciae]|uniref:Nucleolar protein 8 n=1 Tax=Adineta ricciae TaxID=249248 RepID=A0A813UPE5_ADIRI|nr:unnamed protein product [Adineta ricciae]
MINLSANNESLRSVKSNEQRLKSLEEYEREKQKKKRLIKESLTQQQNKTHFKFDSDDDDAAQPQPKKFVEKKIQLFDDNDPPNIEEHFAKKKIPKKRKKLQDLQARLTTTNDPRFQFSEKFLDDKDRTANDDDDDGEDETADPNKEISFEEERKKSLAILDQIAGTKKPVVKPTSKMIRFDPSKTEHRIYELESQSKLDDNQFDSWEDDQSKSKAKQITPAVDSSRVYNFDQTKLKSMFDKTLNPTSTSNGNSSFQFQFFVNKEPVNLPTPKAPTTLTKPISNGKAKAFLSKPDDTSSDEDNHEKESSAEETQTKDEVVNNTFFFFDIDSRLKDGLESFVRTEDLNELERSWPTKRKEIAEALRTKHRKAIQRKDKHRVFNHRHRHRQQAAPKSEVD